MSAAVVPAAAPCCLRHLVAAYSGLTVPMLAQVLQSAAAARRWQASNVCGQPRIWLSTVRHVKEFCCAGTYVSSYIWDISIPNKSEVELQLQSHTTVLNLNLKDTNLLAY